MVSFIFLGENNILNLEFFKILKLYFWNGFQQKIVVKYKTDFAFILRILLTFMNSTEMFF